LGVTRACTIVLAVLLAVLPAIDTVACPDGCSRPVHVASVWHQRDARAGACGLCLNASFVHRALVVVLDSARVVFTRPSSTRACVSPADRPLERPPKHV